MRMNTHRFEDIVNFFDHMRIPISTLEREKIQGDYPYYGAQGVIDYVNDYIFEGEYVLIAEDGANLITRNQPIAQIAKGKFWVNNHAHIVCAKEGVSINYFINILLNSMNLTGYVTGAAQPKLSQKNLRIVNVNMPSFADQIRITSILSAYDDLIENNRRRIQLLEQSARLLYKEWFVYLRFPGHEHTPITDGVPEGWEWKLLGERFQIVLGGTPSRKKSEFWDGDVPWINSGEVNKMRILEATEFISEEGLAKSAAKLMPAGATVLAITGATLGQVSRLEIECSANQSVVGIFDTEGFQNEWLYLFLVHEIKKIINHATGGAQQHINKEIVNAVEYLEPPKLLLNAFRKEVKSVFSQIKTLNLQNLSLYQSRDLLLPRLMDGKVAM